jgi:formylglycine-generating enzyme required for sulfatase activity
MSEGPKHIYIVHARTNTEQVKRLMDDLRQQDIEIWVDNTGLKPGTHDWEQTLRHVIHDAYAVLFVASPDVRRFPFISDELALATMESISVYPVWLAGRRWQDCVPTGFNYPNFIDIRAEAYETGLERIQQVVHGNPVRLQTQEFAAISDVDELDTDAPAPLEPDAIRRNPYIGLHAFTASSRTDFFGRELVIQELLDDVRDGIATLPFLCLVGASGSGKTSILQAGLLPALREGAIAGMEEWIYAPIFTPTAQPIYELALILQPYLTEISPENILTTLNHPSTGGLHRLAQQIAAQPNQRLVLVIDALEELFMLATSDERQQFMDVLTTAIEIPDSRVLVIAALDANFYDRPLQYEHFGRLLQDRHRALLPLSLTELYQAIQRPARMPDVQVRFEKGLTAEIAFALRGERDALPMMQMTLTQLFYLRDGDLLTWTAYQSIGGMFGVIDVLAERTLMQLPSDDHRAAVRTLFLALAHVTDNEGDTLPQAVQRSELTPILESVAVAYLYTGLLTSEGEDNEAVIRITHPILLRRWERLQHWLNEARTDRHFAPLFAADVDLWLKAGQSTERLYRRSQLEYALAWAERNPTTAEQQAFLATAIEERDRYESDNRQAIETAQTRTERLAKRIGALRIINSLLGLIIIAAAIFTSYAWRTAQDERAEAAQLVGREPTLVVMQANAGALSTEVAITQTAVHAEQAQVTEANQQIEAQLTQFAEVQAYDALIQQRAATLAVGAVIMPLADTTQTFPDLVATETQIAELSNWQVVIMEDDFGIPMVEVPAGCFYMGSLAQPDEQPPHLQCFTQSFWIDQFEMTNEFVEMVTGNSAGSQFANPQNPADSVSWFEARDICALREARLPTEAEWEYAARGVDSRVFPWGNEFVAANVVFQRTAQQGAMPVMTANATPLRPASASWVGAVDMLGNIEEWTSTIYDELDYSQRTLNFQNLFPYPYRAADGREADEALDDYQARVNSSAIFTLRVLRGGSFTNTEGLRAANRSYDNANDEDVTSGFRCVR